MWFSIFLLLTFSLFLLPLLPSVIELWHPTDTKPLQVIQAYDTKVTHFAISFNTWLRKNFSTFFVSNDQQIAVNSEGTLKDTTPFQIVGHEGIPSYSSEEIKNNATQKLIISASPLQLMEQMFFEREVYSSSWIKTTRQSQFRAMLADGNIWLSEGCTVLRWVHSNRSLYASKGCRLYGRASADARITVSEHCNFERLNASIIRFGDVLQNIKHDTIQLAILEELPNLKDIYKESYRIDGDLTIPDKRYFQGDIIADGNVSIGAGSRIKGNVKSNKDMYLSNKVRIDGSIVSAGNIYMESGCRVKGPIIAEDTILIKEGCIIGASSLPTTITAPKILITSGVVAYGSVWATEVASVLAASRERA